MNNATQVGDKDEIDVSISNTVSLSFLNDKKGKVSIKNQKEPFMFIIPRNAKAKEPKFEKINFSNLTNSTSKTINQLLTLNVQLKTPHASVHIHLKPDDYKQSYLMVLKYEKLPLVNTQLQIYDSFEIFCPFGN